MKLGLKSTGFSIVLLLAITPSSWATNGYFSHGITAAERALGGAGVAHGTSALSVDANPALLSAVGNDTTMMLNLFAPDRNYQAQGTPSSANGNPCGAQCPFSIGEQNLQSDRRYFLIPSAAFSRRIDERNVIGAALIARGGMNTYWSGGSALLGPQGTTMELPGTFGSDTTQSNLMQVYLKGSFSRQLTDRVALGGALIYIHQRFEVKGISNFAGFSSDPTKLSNRGMEDSWGISVKLGTHVKISDDLSVAASYQPKVNMSEFDAYSGLFANQGDFDFPENYTVGLAWNVSPKRKLLVDVQRINYSDVESLGNPIAQLAPSSCTPSMTGGTGDGCLGGNNGAGFGWDDMTIYKVGYEMPLGKHTLRLGYSHTTQPIAESEVLFNILAPAVIEEHITVGYDMRGQNTSGWQLSFMYAPKNSVTGPNTFDPNQTITLEMEQWEMAAAYSF